MGLGPEYQKRQAQIQSGFVVISPNRVSVFRINKSYQNKRREDELEMPRRSQTNF
jgi:hypothetical protein